MRAITAGGQPHPQSTAGHVIEVDKLRQILLVVDGGTVSQIISVSTGGGYTYSSGGTTHIATTPSGHFTTFRQIDGMHHAPLGTMFRPKYFNGGIALHGDPPQGFPPEPASHGCVRMTNAAIDWVWASGVDPIGTSVWVY